MTEFVESAHDLEAADKYRGDALTVLDTLRIPGEAEAFLRQNLQYDAPQSEIAQRILRGRNLYIRFHLLATRESSDKAFSIQKIVADRDFVLFLFLLHQIPSSLGLIRLEFHYAGTTSFIFKTFNRLNQACALKVIQAPYQKLETVRAATSNYKEQYGTHTTFSPKVFESHPTWILMEFIEGRRLSEFIGDLRNHEAYMSDKYFSAVKEIFKLLNEALSYYEQQVPAIIHGDINPMNILVVEHKGTPSEIRLIDFGPNYVLQNLAVRQKALVETFSQVEIFVAPEVLEGRQVPSKRSDVFSLGMIGLELLSPTRISRDFIGNRLREMWERPATSGFAQIIEDLIDTQPSNRLLVLGQETQVYSTLSQLIEEKAWVYKKLVRKSVDETALRPANLSPDVWNAVKEIIVLLRSADRRFNDVGKGLFFATTLNALCQAIIVSAFVIYTLADARVNWLSNIPLPFVDNFFSLPFTLPRDFVLGDFWGNLPGRCVAVTFGLIAARYYANIFAPLRLSGTKSYTDWACAILMRANSISYFIPIMLAIVWKPQWWPWCAFVGTIFPAANNYFCRLVALDAARDSKGTFSTEVYYDSPHFLQYYREWWVLMLTYSLGILTLGVLLQIGVAKDEAIYGYAVTIINMLKIYRNNCGVEAPFIQGNLSRFYFAKRRLRLVN